MRKWLPIIPVLCALLLLSGCATTKFPGARTVAYFGYSKCIELTNADCRVVLAPEIGGKVLKYSWKGTNVLWMAADEKGWKYGRNTNGIFNCAGRFDIAPETGVPAHPLLWLGKWSGEIVGPRKARLISREDPGAGVQLVREFTLSDDSSRLECRQTMKNVSGKPVRWCYWSRTLALGGGIAVIPLSGKSKLPSGYMMYGPGKQLYSPHDDKVSRRGDFLIVAGPAKYSKLGFDSSAGWLSYLMTNDLMFAKSFPTFPDRTYSEDIGLTAAIYYPPLHEGRNLIEIEDIGPTENLQPGESATFTEEWFLLSHPFPKDAKSLNPDEIQKLVGQMR